jgi:hypothetical protein
MCMNEKINMETHISLVFGHIDNYTSFWTWVLPFILTILNPLPQEWFVPSLIKIDPVILEKSKM